MISKLDFATAVRSVFDELSLLCLRATPDDLARLPGFAAELAEMRSAVCRPDASSAQVLSASCGLVDEFVSRSWDKVISETYDSYMAASGAKRPA
jgi:hypothetical protein